MTDSALVQELAATREALRAAIRIGETLQARVDAALVIAHRWAMSPSVRELIDVLEGRPAS